MRAEGPFGADWPYGGPPCGPYDGGAGANGLPSPSDDPSPYGPEERGNGGGPGGEGNFGR